MTVSLPMSLRGRLKVLAAISLLCLVLCVVNPRRFAAATPDGKTVLRREASLWIAAGFGLLLPKAVSRVQ